MRKAVFLDRDGVLNRAYVKNGKPYAPRTFEDFVINDGAKLALTRLKERGYMCVVATNQPDVGKGIVERSLVEAMHMELMNSLPIDDIRVCYHRQDVGCDCRKPKPGMLLQAAVDLSIDLSNSFMIGDRWSDVAAGNAAGCKTVFLDFGYGETGKVSADCVVGTLDQAYYAILGME